FGQENYSTLMSPTNPVYDPLSTRMGSFHLGRRIVPPGRRPRRSRTALFKLMTMLRFPARTGCTRITTCRNNDFTFRTPEEVLAGLTGTSVAAAQAMAQKTEEAPADKDDAGVPKPRNVALAAHLPGMAMPGMTISGPGGLQRHMDFNDVNYKA